MHSRASRPISRTRGDNKVRNAVLVNSVHSRLADIVKKHSKPHLPLWSDVLNAQTNVTVNIKKMVGIVLPEIKALTKLRYEHRYDLYR